MLLRIELRGLDKLKGKLSKLQEGLKDKTSLFEQSGTVVLESSQRNFEEGGRPRWEPLTETTLLLRAQSKAGYRENKRGKNKGRITSKTFNTYIAGAKALRDSGLLMGSIGNPSMDGIYRLTDISIAIGTALKKARPLQEGVEKTKGLIEGKRIPPRPFMVLRDEDRETIAKFEQDFVKKRLREAGFKPRG